MKLMINPWDCVKNVRVYVLTIKRVKKLKRVLKEKERRGKFDVEDTEKDVEKTEKR